MAASLQQFEIKLLLLARILIRKGGLLQLKLAALTFTCWHDNLESFACILSKFTIHVTNDQFSDKFNND